MVKPQPLFLEGFEERDGKIYLIVRFTDGSVRWVDAGKESSTAKGSEAEFLSELERKGLYPPIVMFVTGDYWVATDGVKTVRLGTADDDLPLHVHKQADLVFIDDEKILEINTDFDGQILRVRRREE